MELTGPHIANQPGINQGSIDDKGLDYCGLAVGQAAIKPPANHRWPSIAAIEGPHIISRQERHSTNELSISSSSRPTAQYASRHVGDYRGISHSKIHG